MSKLSFTIAGLEITSNTPDWMKGRGFSALAHTIDEQDMAVAILDMRKDHPKWDMEITRYAQILTLWGRQSTSETCKHGKTFENPCWQCDEERWEQKEKL